ncbi:MAG: DNA repair protein RecN [Halocynthiibacter sp.]
MLTHLDIRDMLIIDRLELAFQPGLNVLTGETGAGKSILLDSLGFVLGWRGRADMVRDGAKQGEVSAVFTVPNSHPAYAVLAEAGIEIEDDIILRRVNAQDGRKTAWINDRRVSGEVLRQLSETLLELHGQHDDRGLLDPKGHRAMLDRFAGHDSMLDEVGQRWMQLRHAQKSLSKAEADIAALKEEEEYLRHAVGELDALNPEEDEDITLDAARRRMQNAEKVRGDVLRAAQTLSIEGAEGLLSDGMRWLEGVSDKLEGELISAIDAVSRAMEALTEAQNDVDTVASSLDFNPHELEDIEERLFAIRGLARKYNVQANDLSGLADDLRSKLENIDGGDAQIDRLKAELTKAQTAYDAAADALSAARVTEAKTLDAAIQSELAGLKMERAVFQTEVTAADPAKHGKDHVQFKVATNPGAPSGPLNKIASGGELSRFLLALKVALRSDDAGVTMIFDEIDRGVGGATADAVGRRLEALSIGGQTLVVTHSPQVAARGAHHWRVQKEVVEGMTFSRVVPLDEAARIDEIARMLAGDSITEEARAAAKSLLAF